MKIQAPHPFAIACLAALLVSLLVSLLAASCAPTQGSGGPEPTGTIFAVEVSVPSPPLSRSSGLMDEVDSVNVSVRDATGKSVSGSCLVKTAENWRGRMEIATGGVLVDFVYKSPKEV
jgi:hypothetical protein